MAYNLKNYGKQHITEDDINAVVEVLKSDFLTTGPTVSEFENNFAEYILCKHAIAVSSGTTALDLAVRVLGIKEGEIIVTSMSFMASANCILYNNLTPVFCDIDKETLNIDIDKIEEKITDKTKAIIYVDFAGRPCDFNKLKSIADKHNLYLIEDACHAVGSEFNGKKVGSLADLTVFSFHPVKTITTGEGGMITTNNDDFAKKLRILRNHGIVKKEGSPFYDYDMIELGFNYRITDIQCALGISQLKRLNSFIEKRQFLVDEYNSLLSDVEEVITPLSKKNGVCSWHLYYILLNGIDKDKFLNLMKKRGLGVHSFYKPIYNFTYYKKRFNIDKNEFPVAENIFANIVILPLFSQMGEKDVDFIVDNIKEVINIIKNE